MRISHKKDLPTWFDLDNYTQFIGMSDKDLFYQLVVRYDMLENFYRYGGSFYYYPLTNKEEEGASIGNGADANAIDRATYFYDAFKLPIKREGVLSGGVALRPMSIEDFIYMKDAVDNYMENNFTGTAENLVYHSFTSVSSFLEPNDLFIKVDLSRPDDLLIDVFKKNLKNWREELKIKEKEKTYQSWETIKKKVYDYSLFPVVDLMIWAKSRGACVTNGVLAVAVFPNGEYDSTQIAQTVKPNIEKIFSISSIEKIRSELQDRKILP